MPDPTPPAAWWSASNDGLVLPHRYDSCFDLIGQQDSGWDFDAELSALPADAVRLIPDPAPAASLAGTAETDGVAALLRRLDEIDAEADDGEPGLGEIDTDEVRALLAAVPPNAPDAPWDAEIVEHRITDGGLCLVDGPHPRAACSTSGDTAETETPDHA